MNARTTFWLFILAVILAGAVYFTEKRAKVTTTPMVGAALIPQFDPKSVTAIDVTISNQVLRLARTNGAWSLTTPRYPAHQTVVDAFLNVAARVPQLGYITAKEIATDPAGARSFGLEPPRATVLFTSGTSKLRLEVGNRTPITQQVYVRKVGDPGIYLTDASLLEQLPFDLNEWRDPSLFSFDGLSFDALQIRFGNRPLELQRQTNNAGWRITKPIEARADAGQVTTLFAYLRDARVVGFVTDLPTADLEMFGLQNPDLRAAFMLNSNVVEAVEFGRSPTNQNDVVYARRLSHTNVVLVPRQVVELLRLPYKSYHDPQLLALPANLLTRIDVSAADKFSITQTNDMWLIQGTNSFMGDKELVQEFLVRVSALEILDFGKEAPTEQDLTALDLNPPTRRYSFFAPQTNASVVTNTIVAHLDFGRTNSVTTVFARRSDEIPIYVTQLGSAQELPSEAWELRERVLWTLDANSVTNLTVKLGETEKSVTKDRGTGWARDQLLREMLSEIVHRLATAKAEAWTGVGEASLARYGLAKSSQEITLIAPGADANPIKRTIAFGHRGPRGNVYAGTILPGDTRPTVFQLSGKLYMDLVSNLFAPLSE